VITSRIQMRRGEQIIEAADDVRVKIAVAVAALQRAAGVGRTFEARIRDARAGKPGEPNLYKPKCPTFVVPLSMPLSLTSTTNPEASNCA
jgi:hypothetical protein